MAGKGRGLKGDDGWWKEAIRTAVSRKDSDGRKKLHRIADALVKQAIGGDVQAAKEIGDRLDGKARQPIDQTVTVVSLGDAIVAAARSLGDARKLDPEPEEVRH